MTWLQFDIGLGCGLALAGLLYLALRWWVQRTSSAPSAMTTDRGVTARPEEAARDAPSQPTIAPSTAPAPSIAPETADPVPLVQGIDERPSVRNPSPSRSGAAVGTVRLSQRVILHVYAQGVVPMGAVAPPGLSQAGIGEALGVRQGGLAAVLRRLEAAGVLTAERGHVRGRDRRLKIYRLSPRGIELARDLRARSTRGPAAARAAKSKPELASPPR